MGQVSGRGCEGSSALERQWGGAGVLKCGGCAGAGREPRQGEGVQRAATHPYPQVAKLRWGLAPSHVQGFAECMATAGPALHGASRGEVLNEAQVAQL